MSTVCYCGRPDCSVTSMARDACLTTLRAERDALKAQVEAARKACMKRLGGTYSGLTQTTARLILNAMDEAAK